MAASLSGQVLSQNCLALHLVGNYPRDASYYCDAKLAARLKLDAVKLDDRLIEEYSVLEKVARGLVVAVGADHPLSGLADC